MAAPIVAELEALATEMRRRGWIARAGVLNDTGDVLSLCGVLANGELASPAPPDFTGTIAHLAVANVDGRSWLYVDLGSTRWMARLEPAHDVTGIATWLTARLQKLGVTVERDAVAQE